MLHDNINPTRYLKKPRFHFNFIFMVVIFLLKAIFNSYQWLSSAKDNDSFYSTLSLDRGSGNNLNDLNKNQVRKIENLKNTAFKHFHINSLQNQFIFVQSIIRDFDIF